MFIACTVLAVTGFGGPIHLPMCAVSSVKVMAAICAAASNPDRINNAGFGHPAGQMHDDCLTALYPGAMNGVDCEHVSWSSRRLGPRPARVPAIINATEPSARSMTLCGGRHC